MATSLPTGTGDGFLDEPPRANEPARPPDWRWQRARWLHAKCRPAYKEQDACVTLLCMMLSDEAGGASPGKLQARYSCLYEAMRFHQDGSGRAMRDGVEAYLCAGATDQQIAIRASLSPQTIYCYAKAFFDVRDRRDRLLWMLAVAERDSDPAGKQPGRLWKMLGLVHGPLFLDSLFAGGNWPPAKYSGDMAQLHNMIREMIGVKAMMASCRFDSEADRRAILASHTKLLALAGQIGEQVPDSVDEGFRRLCELLKPEMISPDPNAPPPFPVEMRADELAAGEWNIEKYGDPRTWKFPDQPSSDVTVSQPPPD